MQIEMQSVASIRSMDHEFSPVDDTRYRGYLRERFNKTMEHLSRATGRVATEFMERSSRLFEKVNSHEALRKVRAISRNVKGSRRGNIIHYVRDLEDCRSAGFAMQRWLMTSVALREAFLKQRIDGYHATYDNLHGEDIGEKHYDFRRATNGMLRSALNENGEREYFVMEYFEHLLEGDRELEIDEKETIADAVWIAEMMLAAGFDPTDAGAGRETIQ